MQITHAMPVYAPAWQFGGPVLSVSRLCEAIAREGVGVRVITTNAGLPDWPAADLGKPIFERGVEVIRYAVDRQDNPIRSRALELALPQALAGSQLLHLSAIWQPLGLALQRAALAHDIPVLHSLRGALGPYSLGHGWWKKLPYLLLLERPLLKRAAGLHVTSHQEARELDWLRLNVPRHLLPNPLDLSALRPDPALRQQWRRRLGIRNGVRVLLVCGRQHHKKGLDMLPELLASQRHQPWCLLLVGGDDDGSGVALRRSMQQRGLGERLLLEPTMPAADLVGVYNAADLLLLPSRHENFGNVVVEALACGCAVLISERTGVGADLLEAAPRGFGAVLPRQQMPWQNWLGAWLKQPQRAGEAVASWTGERYGQQAVARQAIELYRLILQTRANTPTLH
jgi:glycosyltransferase involved in cell wall biosynthesis